MLNSHSINIYEAPSAEDTEVNKTDKNTCPHKANTMTWIIA